MSPFFFVAGFVDRLGQALENLGVTEGTLLKK